jgi:CheY-like chemotaxis protein
MAPPGRVRPTAKTTNALLGSVLTNAISNAIKYGSGHSDRERHEFARRQRRAGAGRVNDQVRTDERPIVLLVEDDVDIREAVSDTLEDVGYRVVSARHGREALDLLHDDGAVRPCAILLDLMMPVMDGWQFRAEQTRDPAIADIPVVALSAHGGLCDLDATDHLRKPVQLNKLIDTLHRICPIDRGAA